MEDENPKYSYTYRSINIAAASCLLSIFLVIFGFGFAWNVKLTLEFALMFVAFTLCCCIAYFSASGIAFYFKETFQKYVPAWLIISFFGSAIFNLSAGIIHYVLTLIAIRNYTEPTKSESIFSPYEHTLSSFPSRPELPTLDTFVSRFLIHTLILFVITCLVSSVASLIASKIPEKRTEESYTFLDL